MSADPELPSPDPDLPFLALEAFYRDYPDWRILWSQIFVDLALNVVLTIDGTEARQEGLALQNVFTLLADMFSDGHVGARHPLASAAPVQNRPRQNTLAVQANTWIAAVAGCEIALGKQERRPLEQSYRKAALRITMAGAKLSWREVRSAWHNIHRSGENPLLAALLERSAVAGYVAGPLDALATFAADKINRKHRSFD